MWASMTRRRTGAQLSSPGQRLPGCLARSSILRRVSARWWWGLLSKVFCSAPVMGPPWTARLRVDALDSPVA